MVSEEKKLSQGQRVEVLFFEGIVNKVDTQVNEQLPQDNSSKLLVNPTTQQKPKK